MYLDKTASHQLRTLLACVPFDRDYVKVGTLRQAPGLTEAHMNKIVGSLVRLGLVETRKGIYGGVRLRAGVAERPLGQIVAKLIGTDFKLARQRSLNGRSGRKIDSAMTAGFCAFLAELNRHTLADVADEIFPRRKGQGR
jgi:Rrf2 family nitric oxide-sensitive transcriptional repressor